jgi:hypothetical protein
MIVVSYWRQTPENYDFFQTKSKLLVLTMVKFYVLAGSVLQSMAVAVEEAAVIIICISAEYQASFNCQTGSGSFHPN